VPHLLNGELAIELPDIETKKAYIRDQIENRVWESELRPEMPHQHYVDLTVKVADLRSKMYEKLHGGRI
jgi:nicotinate phosphoribosyltransferase